MRNLVPRVIFWSYLKCHRGKSLTCLANHDDLLEQAYGYKVNETYPEGCTLNKKRSIRRKAEKLVLVNGEVRLKKKTKGTNEIGKKLHS